MSKESAVRDAAQALKDAIDTARASGLVVQWPTSSDGLTSIPISETGKVTVSAQVDPGAGIDPAVVAKAGVAAQKAADKVVDRASDKA